ncbi:hypothetical protein [Bacillus sp. PS06]|uniref:hypothetical protein n=1 Tax=Bacillus sp. PS06 TaxID=2764176 RepID=UPI0017806C68|nr:hypothetical protein [Bacillus sp. PS06]MBD8068856.1 hypothetical protein [Bacillus sp. PS06]
MKLLKNQKGYALLLVLVIIVIIGIIIPLIMSSITNSARQYELTAQHLQNDKLVSMGEMYIESVVDRIVQNASENANSTVTKCLEGAKNSNDYKNCIGAELGRYQLSPTGTSEMNIQLDSNNGYKIKIVGLAVNESSIGTEKLYTVTVKGTITPFFGGKFDTSSASEFERSIKLVDIP